MDSKLNAFVLAAGLGTRLRPITYEIPKSFIPIFHKPLITFAFDSLLAAGVDQIALNTHYLPEIFVREFSVERHGLGSYRGYPLSIFHEPVLLNSGGTLRNARHLLNQGTFLIYNGDTLTDIPFKELLDHHRASGAMATLLLLEGGGVANICYDEENNNVRDLRGLLGGDKEQGGKAFVYGGVAAVEPELLDWIEPEGPASIIEALSKVIRAHHRVGGFVKRDHFWNDLGTPEAYLETHRRIIREQWKPSYLTEADKSWPEAIHPTARIASSVEMEGMVVIGPEAQVGQGARLKDCLILPGAIVAPHTILSEAIVGKEQRWMKASKE